MYLPEGWYAPVTILDKDYFEKRMKRRENRTAGKMIQTSLFEE